MLQSPTLDEGGLANGRYARIVKFDTGTGEAVARYAYLLDRAGQGQGISALVALGDESVLRAYAAQISGDIAPMPEPGNLALVFAALGALAAAHKRRDPC